jgi:dinuclear metal center YbgI/SA1388 family protein
MVNGNSRYLKIFIAGKCSDKPAATLGGIWAIFGENTGMKIAELIRFLESRAPLSLQESYDNAGLICGNASDEIKAVLVSLDCTEDVVEEAIRKGCNVIVSHHPIVFKGLKKITGANYVERTVLKAIRNDIALYAIHTNLDHVNEGVNARFATQLGLQNTRILQPKTGILKKLGVYVPSDHAETLRNALFAAGAGQIGNYSDCSFNMEGYGTYFAGEGAHPAIGEIGIRHREPEVRVEVVFPAWIESSVLTAMKANHPYEEVAYDLVTLDNSLQTTGAGMVGDLAQEMSEQDFLQMLKSAMGLKTLRYSPFVGRRIRKVAICGGSGSFLLQSAMRAGADAFVTGDFKYHEFFDAEGRILIADIGHYESERFTIDLLGDWIKKKFPTFAVHLTETNTNPINYL